MLPGDLLVRLNATVVVRGQHAKCTSNLAKTSFKIRSLAFFYCGQNQLVRINLNFMRSSTPCGPGVL